MADEHEFKEPLPPSIPVKSNVLPDLQDIFADSETALMTLLNFDDERLSQYDLSLLDRAKLFAITRVHSTTAAKNIRSIKARTKNLNLNDAAVPTIKQLTRFKRTWGIEDVELAGIKSQKEKLLMSIFFGALEQHADSADCSIEDLIPAQLLPEYARMIGQFDGDEEIASAQLSHEEGMPLNDDAGSPLPIKRKRCDDEESSVAGTDKRLFEKEDVVDKQSSDGRRSICVSLDVSEPAAAGPAHSLEPNLILCFIYLAGRQLGVTEADVLHAAQRDTFGYLSSWTDFSLLLKKAHWALRPVNVPFKPKWLRETASSLQLVRDDEDEGLPSADMMLAKQLYDLGLLYNTIIKVSTAVLSKTVPKNG